MITKTRNFLPTIIALSTLLMFVGCATPPEPPPPPKEVAPVVVVPQETPEQIAERELNAAARVTLKEGIDLYNAGDYNGALKHLVVITDNSTIDKATQLDALKYMAFSDCLTKQQTLCKQQFEKALKLDPSFDLLPGEKGHPLWGPVFAKVKKG